LIFPWVWRRKYDLTMRLLDEKSGRIAELRDQLTRAESERREAQLQMLRLLAGAPIFAEQPRDPAPLTAAETVPQLSFATMTEAEIDAHLVGEAQRAGCVTMPQISRYVERRKRQLWDEANPEEARLKARAVASVETAISEGAATGAASGEAQ
jgi:hypothetical protein